MTSNRLFDTDAQRLEEAGIEPSVGSKGDSYDNQTASAETGAVQERRYGAPTPTLGPNGWTAPGPVDKPRLSLDCPWSGRQTPPIL